MEKIYLHNFTKTGKKTGFDLNCHIVKVIRNCGIELDCPCGDCKGCETTPTPSPAINQQVNSIVAILSYVKDLEEKIDNLQKELNVTQEIINSQ